MSQRTENQVAEMKKQTLGVEVEMRRDLREPVERGLVAALQNVDFVRDVLLVELHAVS